MQNKIDILIENGTLLTFNDTMEVIENGWIAIQDNKIVAMGGGNEEPAQMSAIHRLDAKNKLILPGFINTHTHVPMSYFKGIADDLPLDIWLNNHIWPLEKKMVSPDFVYFSSLHGIAELIKNGVTTFNDMYFENESLAKAAKEAGIRAILGEGIMDFPAASHLNADSYLAYTEKLLEKYKGDELISVSVAPHSIYTCSEDTLKKAKALAHKYNALIHIHLAETESEYNNSLNNHQKTPTKYLADLGVFDGKTIAAHSVWLSDEDIKILAEQQVSVAINTESNLKLASGFQPIKKCLAQGVNLTIATDGVASNNNLSIIEEMSATAKIHKALNSDPSFLPAKTILQFPTINAAKAINKQSELGSLEIGKKADLILIDSDNIESLPLYDPYSQIVYAQNSSHVTDVIINGKVVLFNRQLMTLDEQEIKERARYFSKQMR